MSSRMLSRNKSKMIVVDPWDMPGAGGKSKMETVISSDAVPISPSELQKLISQLTAIEKNDDRLALLEERKVPYLFTSENLSRILDITPSEKTKLCMIQQIGPRLTDPSARSDHFKSQFRFNEQKLIVEDVLKARQQVLAGSGFKQQPLLGRGGPGRGAGRRSSPGPGSSSPTPTGGAETTAQKAAAAGPPTPSRLSTKLTPIGEHSGSGQSQSHHSNPHIKIPSPQVTPTGSSRKHTDSGKFTFVSTPSSVAAPLSTSNTVHSATQSTATTPVTKANTNQYEDFTYGRSNSDDHQQEDSRFRPSSMDLTSPEEHHGPIHDEEQVFDFLHQLPGGTPRSSVARRSMMAPALADIAEGEGEDDDDEDEEGSMNEGEEAGSIFSSQNASKALTPVQEEEPESCTPRTPRITENRGIALSNASESDFSTKIDVSKSLSRSTSMTNSEKHQSLSQRPLPAAPVPGSMTPKTSAVDPMKNMSKNNSTALNNNSTATEAPAHASAASTAPASAPVTAMHSAEVTRHPSAVMKLFDSIDTSTASSDGTSSETSLLSPSTATTKESALSPEPRPATAPALEKPPVAPSTIPVAAPNTALLNKEASKESNSNRMRFKQGGSSPSPKTIPEPATAPAAVPVPAPVVVESSAAPSTPKKFTSIAPVTSTPLLTPRVAATAPAANAPPASPSRSTVAALAPPTSPSKSVPVANTAAASASYESQIDSESIQGNFKRFRDSFIKADSTSSNSNSPVKNAASAPMRHGSVATTTSSAPVMAAAVPAARSQSVSYTPTTVTAVNSRNPSINDGASGTSSTSTATGATPVKSVHRFSGVGMYVPPNILMGNSKPAAAVPASNANDLPSKYAALLQLSKDAFLALIEELPVRVDETSTLPQYTYRELLRRNFSKQYGELKQNELEKYLLEEEFTFVFKKTKGEFLSQPQWKQVDQKKKAMLF